MRAVVTRVKHASVTIDGAVNGRIGEGFLVLLGVAPADTEETAVKLADKVCKLRVFEDENDKMNLNLEQVGGSLLVISQFTLFADTSSRRPGFSGAAKPDLAIPLYEKFMPACGGEAHGPLPGAGLHRGARGVRREDGGGVPEPRPGDHPLRHGEALSGKGGALR